MKLIYNFILIVLMTFVIWQPNYAFSQTQNEIKPEKDVDAKIIPVKNFREKIKLNFPQKENQQTNNEKKEKRKSKINFVKFKKDDNKSLKVDEKTKKKFNIEEDNIDKKTVNAKVTKNENENKKNTPTKKKKVFQT